jgi:hypothetical protein
LRSRTRTQVYWRDGRLHPVTNHRPSGLGPWPKISAFSDNDLVATLEGETGSIVIDEGPAATPDRVDAAFLLHRGIPPASVAHGVWATVPESLRSALESRVSGAETKVARQWGRFSNEEAITGALFSQLDGTLREGGWKIEISFVEFSKQVKEPLTGTDVAVVLDALNAEGQRSFKTIWLQAKSLPSAPANHTSAPRMASQLPLAKAYCEASYGLVYSPDGVHVLGAANEPEPLHTTIGRAVQCHIGDTTVGALKNSLNRKRLLQVIATESAAPSRRRMAFRR